MRRRVVALATFAACLAISGPAAAEQMAVNGGFEEPDIPTGTWNNFSSINGWQAGNSCGVEVQDHVAGAPFEGGQFVELNSNCKSEITQRFILAASSITTITWQFSPRPGTLAEDNKLEVLVDGKLKYTMGPIPGGSTTTWQKGGILLDRPDVSRYSYVTFRSAGSNPSGGGVGVYLDDVKITRTALIYVNYDCFHSIETC
jgi:hypothetical protein